MAFNLDFLLLRRPRLDYISPPICEVFFSSTGVVIELEPFASSIITGLALGGTGGGNLVWDVFPEAVCYNIYKESETPGVYDLVLECTPNPDIPFPNPPGCYKVSAITPSGETDLSDPFCISAVLPTVLTLPPTDIQPTSAILNGAVNPMGFSASAFFQWGATLAYGNSTVPSSVGAGTANLSFDDVINGLSPGATYHYRAAATNGDALIVGLDQEFTAGSGGGGDDCNDNGHGENRIFIDTSQFGAFDPVSTPSSAPAWDGWIRYQIPPNSPDLGGFCVLGIEGDFSIQGYQMPSAYFYFFIPTNSWYVEIWHAAGFLLWKGRNQSPDDNVMEYVNDMPASAAGSPAVLTVAWGIPP